MLTVGKMLDYLNPVYLGRGGKSMDENLMAAIMVAVQAYIETENKQTRKRFGQRLNPWKMGTRRETMRVRNLAVRGNPARVRLRRFSLL